MGETCKILWFEDHDFEKWKIKEESNIIRGKDPEGIIGRMILQNRVCKKCGLTETRRERIELI